MRRTRGRGSIARRAILLTVLTSLALLAPAFGTVGPASAALPPRPAAPHHAVPLDVGSFGSPGINWTMFMGNIQHDSYQAESPSLNVATAANLSLQWNFSSGGPIISEPIVANNRVFFGSWDGYEYSVYASNGSKVWSTFTGQSSCTLTARHLVGVTSTATLTNNGLYFGGGKDYWVALNPSNGSLLWQIYSGNSNGTTGAGYYNWGSPVLYNGYAYIGLSSHCDNPLVQGQLLKVSLATHAVVGVFNTTPKTRLGATIWSSPAVDPATNEVFFATGNLYNCCGTNVTLDDSIVAVNASTMTLVDHFQVPYAQRISDGDFGASVTLFQSDNGTPMIGDDNKDGLYFALNESDLAAGALWTDNISLIPGESSAAFAHGNLYVGSARTTTPSGQVVQGALRSINATTGVVNWQRTMNGNVYGPPVVADDVVVAAGGNELAVLNAASGKVLFHYTAAAQFYDGPTVAGGRIYVGDVYGKLYCFGFPLAATATANVTMGPAPLHVAFHGAGFGGEAGYNFSWSFGDGKHSGIEDPHHAYTTAGTYTVVLQVSDLSGAVANTSIVVNVGEPLVQTIPAGLGPSYACYDAADGDEYVANAGSSNVSVLAGTQVIANLVVGTTPSGMVYDPNRGDVYVSNSGSGNVSVLHGTSVVAAVPVGTNPQVPAYDSKNGYVYVPTGNNVSILGGTSVVANVSVGTGPDAAVYDLVEDRVYVANALSDNVSVIHGTAVVGSIPVGTDPGALSVDSYTGAVYVANTGSNNVSVILGTSVTGTIALGTSPFRSTYDPLNGDVYVAGSSGTVSVLNGTTVLATLRVGTGPGTPAYDGTDGYVYVPSSGTNNVSVLDGTHVLRSIEVGTGPSFAGYASGNAYVYVLNTQSDNISAILTYHLFPLNFTETGLPVGTPWSVTFGASVNASTTSVIGFKAVNGSYSFSVVPVPDYYSNVSTGFAVVSGANLSVSIAFALGEYPVKFVETGLPAGANWSASVNGTFRAGVAGPGPSSNVSILELNGTYPYSIGSPPYFAPNITGGVLTVHGANVTVWVSFVRFNPEFTVTFGEQGLGTGARWAIDLGGTKLSATVNTTSLLEPGTSIAFVDELNGTYPFEVTAPSGLGADPEFGNVTVSGHDVNVTVTFGPQYGVVFTENSLPSGSVWSIDLAGVTKLATVGSGGTSSITFLRINGTYAFSVTAPAGFRASPPSGGVTVSGINLSRPIAFSPIPPPISYVATFQETGLRSGTTWVVLLNGSTGTGTGMIQFLGLANGTYAFQVSAPTGYTATPGSGTITIAGANVTTDLVFNVTHPGSVNHTANGTTGARFLGLPALEGYALVGLIVLVVALAVVYLVQRGRRGGGADRRTSSDGTDTPPPTPRNGDT